MQHYSEQPSSSLLGPIIVGMVMGGVITALFTPRRGEDVRQFIKHRAQSVKKDAKDASDELKNQIVDSDPL